MRPVWLTVPECGGAVRCEQREGDNEGWYKICPGSDAGMQNWLPIVQSPPPLLVVMVVVTMSSFITSS